MRWVWFVLPAACGMLVSACAGSSTAPIRAVRPTAPALVSDIATSPIGVVSTPRLVFVVAAPNVNVSRVPIGSALKASDYKVLMTGDHVTSAKYHTGQIIAAAGSGGPWGALELALDATGTSTMTRWARDHPRSAVTALVDGRVLAQSTLAKHVASGKMSFVSTGPGVTVMGRLVASAIRTTP